MWLFCQGEEQRSGRCKVDSGTFGRELMAFAKALSGLVEDVKVLVGADIYTQRLVRCLSHPYNKKALGDFLVQDNICRDLCDLRLGEEVTGALRKAREPVFEAVSHVTDFSGERGRVLYTALLHWTLVERTAEGIWEALGWK